MSKDPRIAAMLEDPKRLLVKNCNLSVKEIEDMTRGWKTTKKVAAGIAGSFATVKDLEEKHINHFRTQPYLFKPASGTLFGGMCLDDSLDYVHIVIVSEEVLTFILDLK
jgi:hypothetical protein